MTPENFPEATTRHFAAGQNPSEGKLYGEISGLLENNFVSQHGHVWSVSPDSPPSIEDNLGQTLFEKKSNGSFQSELSGLIPGRAYFYRAYLIDDNQVVYGEVKSFTTASISPVIRIDRISEQEEEDFTVIVLTTISNLPPGLPLQSFGLTWSNDPLPEIPSDPFVAEQSILAPDSVYQFERKITLPEGESYLRPFLQAGNETYYGNSALFSINNVWIQKADFGGGGRFDAVSFSIGQKGYIGTGNARKDFWEYDPESDVWTQRANFEGGTRVDAVGFSIGQKGYMGMGILRMDFWEYDPVTDFWTQRADFGGGDRFDAVGFSIGQKGYVGIGLAFSETFELEYKKDFWEYDPESGVWTQRADFAGGQRTEAVGFPLARRVMLVLVLEALGQGVISGNTIQGRTTGLRRQISRKEKPQG